MTQDDLPESAEAPLPDLGPSITDQLDAPLDEGRVRPPPQGKFGDYLEAWDVIATANHIFGYDGWSYSLENLETRESGFTHAVVAVNVVFPHSGRHVHREDVGVGIPGGDSAEAMDTAIKGAVTDGLKRALRTFGPQFGNTLYDKDRKKRVPKTAVTVQMRVDTSRPAPPVPAEDPSGRATHIGDLLTRGMKAASLQRNDVLAIVGKNNDGKSNHLDWIELHMPAAKHTPEEQVLGVLEMAHTKRFDMDLKGPKREAVLEALGE